MLAEFLRKSDVLSRAQGGVDFHGHTEKNQLNQSVVIVNSVHFSLRRASYQVVGSFDASAAQRRPAAAGTQLQRSQATGDFSSTAIAA